jgi:NAD(P)-dependent dehydrogenase (short-subunit alcohol dehydrogenase family)
MSSMQDRVAIVTGGSAGIGRAAALAFAREGAYIAIGDVQVDRGEHVVEEIETAGGKALFVAADVSKDGDVHRLVDETIVRFGRLDYAFNNAGTEGEPAPTDECTPENWNRTININLSGVWLCMRAELPPMLASGGGAIVNNSSVAGLVGFPSIPAYVASKHGVVGLTKAAALEYATRGIRVNAVCPGVVETEMVARFTRGDPAALTELTATEPIGRVGTPEEISDAVVWLCSDRASFVTGQAIAVDGGFVAQ